MNNYNPSIFKEKISLVEDKKKLKINDFIHRATLELKVQILQSMIEAAGIDIQLTTTTTNGGGTRLWFKCPLCESRRGTLFEDRGIIGCRSCLNLYYKGQRFKGMPELLKIRKVDIVDTN